MVVFSDNINKKDAKLGYPFLKKYDIIFNLDSRHLGFYNFKIKYEYQEGNKNGEIIIHNDKNNKNGEKDKGNETNKDKKKNNIKNENDKKMDNNFSIEKIIFIILMVIIIILVLYLVFISFRKYERKRKGKIYNELFL